MHAHSFLQLTEDKQHPWKRNALLGMAGQQKDVILQINKSVQDGISPVLTRGKRDVPKKKRKGGKYTACQVGDHVFHVFSL